MLRNIGAVLAGLIAGCIGLGLVAFLGGSAFPTHAEVSLGDPGAIKTVFAELPVQVKLVIMAAWFAAGVVGGLVARWISGRGGPVWTVAILFAVYVAMNIAVLPMPGWMQAASLAAPILGGVIAHRFGPLPRLRPVEAEGDDWSED